MGWTLKITLSFIQVCCGTADRIDSDCLLIPIVYYLCWVAWDIPPRCEPEIDHYRQGKLIEFTESDADQMWNCDGVIFDKWVFYVDCPV